MSAHEGADIWRDAPLLPPQGERAEERQQPGNDDDDSKNDVDEANRGTLRQSRVARGPRASSTGPARRAGSEHSGGGVGASSAAWSPVAVDRVSFLTADRFSTGPVESDGGPAAAGRFLATLGGREASTRSPQSKSSIAGKWNATN